MADQLSPTALADSLPAPDRALQPWTVQCSYADHYTNTVVVEAKTPEEACERAIEAANGSDCWKSLDWCGPTFVDALAPGEDVDPWDRHGSRTPVPDAYTEAGEAPTIIVVQANGAVREARIVGHGAPPLRLIVETVTSGMAARTALKSVGHPPKLPAHINGREAIYYGRRNTEGSCRVVVVEANGTMRPLDPRLELENRSPTGFEWGYAGSGPAQLALALCADALGDDEAALSVFQRFKFAVVAHLHRSRPWSMTAAEVRARCAALRREQP